MIATSPARVERPADREALARLLRDCDARGEAVVFRGGDTFASFGFAAERCDVEIDLRALDRIAAYEPADLTISVECGVTVGTLERTLAEHGQFVALDVPRAATATVGGALAAGWLGPRRNTYGRARDAIIGSTAVLADGTVASAGGMVVKNVTGYDLSRLYVGSLGTLVAIASVNFKVMPLPQFRVALRAAIPAGGCGHAVAAVLANDVEPTAALLSIGYANELGGEPGADGSLLAIFEGSESSTARGIQSLTASLSACGISLAPIDRPAEHALAKTIDASIAPANGDSLIYKTFGTGAPLETRRAALKSIAQQHGFAFEAILDICTGDLTARFSPSDPGAGAALALDVAVHARPERALVLRAPQSVRDRLAMWGRPAGGLSVMAGLKAQFDPKRTLAPGRFLNRL